MHASYGDCVGWFGGPEEHIPSMAPGSQLPGLYGLSNGGCFDVLGLETYAYEAGWELLEAGDGGEDSEC